MPASKLGGNLDMSDPLQVAVKVTTVEGALALLAQQVSQGLGNVQSQLSALQADSRDNGKQIAAIVSSQHEVQAHSQGLERLSAAIERSTEENVQWRRTHEAENRGVADAVTTAKGALKLIAWSGVFIIGLVVFTVQMQFESAGRDRLRIEASHATDVQRLERRADKIESVQESREKRFQALEQNGEAMRERANMKGLK